MKYDFIVVGAGPAGANIAANLAASKKAPSVLLLEAGGANNEVEDRVLVDRWTTAFTRPSMNWNYMTVPQENLQDRELFYARGKGLGGSSCINFGFYTRGPAEDYDEWARQVGDDFFDWKHAEERYNRLEGYGVVSNEKHRKYVNPKPEDHRHNGPVKVEFPHEWERTMDTILDASYDYGLKPNLDINNGDVIGIGVCPATAHKSYRSTAATAYLSEVPSNLTIVTDSPGTKIIFDGKRAVGIVAGGKEYYANNEIILSAGALDTPKILLLSGVGPKEELARHNIPLVMDLPVGQGLQDHLHVAMSMQLKDGTNDRAEWSSPSAMEVSRQQFTTSGSGNLTILNATALAGFFPGDSTLFTSPEFHKLPPSTQAYIKKPQIPTWELATCIPPLTPLANPSHTYLTAAAFALVPQSRGTVTLRSTNPSDPPVSNPNFLSHPFDRLNMIQATRHIYNYLTSPHLSANTITPFVAPASASEADILAYIEENANSTWHMSCTARMGKAGDETAVVDTSFRVRGLKGLRVVDVSVLPFLVNCHTQSTAYFVGESAGERVRGEYGLDA